jgi:DUF1680 family protein
MEVDLHKLKINDPFLGQYQQLVRDVVIPTSGMRLTTVSPRRIRAMR